MSRRRRAAQSKLRRSNRVQGGNSSSDSASEPHPDNTPTTSRPRTKGTKGRILLPTLPDEKQRRKKKSTPPPDSSDSDDVAYVPSDSESEDTVHLNKKSPHYMPRTTRQSSKSSSTTQASIPRNKSRGRPRTRGNLRHKSPTERDIRDAVIGFNSGQSSGLFGKSPKQGNVASCSHEGSIPPNKSRGRGRTRGSVRHNSPTQSHVRDAVTGFNAGQCSGGLLGKSPNQVDVASSSPEDSIPPNKSRGRGRTRGNLPRQLPRSPASKTAQATSPSLTSKLSLI